MTGAVGPARALCLGQGAPRWTDRDLAAECAVALSFDGTTHAVMMASPCDLEDFALGFALSEGIVAQPGEITQIEQIDHPQGIEMRMWLAAPRGARLAARRRAMAGPVGCGLCGLDSLAAAERALPPLPNGGLHLSPGDLAQAMKALRQAQSLHARTRATHGAGLWQPGAGLVCAREDVGRHNALDKLIGARARTGADLSGGVVVMTSRLSIELVQKAVLARAPVLAGASAPTARAVAAAQAAGLTLIGRLRGNTAEVYSHPARIGQTVRSAQDAG
ncbi:formate dehydrogenase accessory sulfurtransferase FdhD [Rhodovulum adriaticum]|uniref:Sulfur carrier protein FdhD n=1 Tax=Rhodovulum adriaticum TaxID=35804 RepID=A0A4R2NTR0_RHOAD|nr:formate dehydrogenase accessory sulfurtransferase FdhD [Rhodovulum adriaticum]MBK1635980.1 hypothetical protein [Rhodovulum adriaticum]TCP25439.1 FdhD protein [Rhodovulum adriaticum]